jgi:signal transduction histidine kinase
MLAGAGGSRAGYESARLKLARLRLAGGDARAAAMRQIAETSARALNVERVGIWAFKGAGGRLIGVCQFQLSTASYPQTGLPDGLDFPTLLQEIRERRVVAISDVRADERTRELVGPYLGVHGIASMMLAPVIRDGNVVGAICSEQVGAPRGWSQEDRDFAACAADMAALFLEQADRMEIEASLHDRIQRELADERMMALGLLARSVAHDMNSVLGALDLIGVALEADARRDVAGHGAEMRKTVAFGARLVEQMSLFGRQEIGAPDDVDLEEMLRRIEPVLARVVFGKRFELQLGAPGATVRVAGAEMKQLVLNLCVNAGEAIAESGLVRVELREPRADEPFSPTAVVLAVTDDGIGMDEETKAHIFELLLAQGLGAGDRPLDRVGDRQARERDDRRRQRPWRGDDDPDRAAARRFVTDLGHVVPARPTATTARPRGAFRSGGGVLLFAGAALLVVVGAGFWAHRRLRAEVERQVAADMQAVLATAVRGVGVFLASAERLGALVADAPDVRAAATRGPSGGDPAALAAALGPYLQAGKLTGYVITDGPSLVVAATPGLATVGQRLTPEAFPAAEAVRAGAPHAGLPFRAPDGPVRLLVVAPIRGSGLVLGLGIDHGELSAPLLAARAGKTGETYAFDAQGVMISGSRFPQHLRRSALLGPDDDDSALRVEIRDPGGDLTRGFLPEPRRRDQPLTEGARQAIAGADGVAVIPYRDYRGVPVVGAWTWVPARGFGVLSELDAAEAFESLDALERVFTALLALLAVMGAGAVAAAALAERARRRARLAERAARRLGEYVIERKLGGGAMGEVYLARHALLRRPTALKLLRQTDGAAIDRFEREVTVTASLTHPNTIAIYDYGSSEGGSFYYAMEYLEGIDLERFVARFGPAPDARVVHILRQVYGSLAEAHGHGLVHRDIKPANIFLCRRGGVPDLVKVLDFGLAKAADGRNVTRASVVVGTPENMAPELFESADKASPVSDLYAVGCVGYTLLTGRQVFAGSSLAELCNAHLSKTPAPPSQILGRPVDAVLERVILASLAKDPALRPQSAREILALFDRSPPTSGWTLADATAFWTANGDTLARAADAVG